MNFRTAQEKDIKAIVAMLADDPLGQTREDVGPSPNAAYLSAFEAIDKSTNQRLAVAENDDGELIGTLQISFLPGLSHRGAWRGQIEAVRIAKAARGTGVGQAFIKWAIEQCRARGCRMVQLTSDKSRFDAHRFYERLGFVPSHTGFKLPLAPTHLMPSPNQGS